MLKYFSNSRGVTCDQVSHTTLVWSTCNQPGSPLIQPHIHVTDTKCKTMH